MILEKIFHYKKEELEHFKHQFSMEELKGRVRDQPTPLAFEEALRNPDQPFAVIAEIKQRSPSKGILREDFNPVTIASDYQTHGATALSVLTDEHFFGGHLDHLRTVRKVVQLPLLRKDFIWDPYQIYAAREAGADAILLIVAMLEKAQLEDLQGEAQELGMAVLVEIHDEVECATAVASQAALIGINNRDLKTFDVSLETSERLLPRIPAETLKVAESGIGSREDLQRLQASGAHAFLIGESFMKAKHPGKALSQFMQKEKT